MSVSSPKTYAAVTVTSTAAAILPSTDGDNVTVLHLNAPTGNSAAIYVGDSSVDASVERGIKLAPGERLTIEGASVRGGGTGYVDTTAIFADAASNQTLCISALVQK